MAKTLEDAVALYRLGNSPAECGKQTGIHYKKIEREVKRLGVKKGDLSSLTHDIARDVAEYVKLPGSTQDAVSKEVARINHAKSRRDTIADKVFDRIELSILSCEDNVVKSLADALDRVCITAEIAPRFNAPAIINNTNAQQNNEQKKITYEVVR
jgi:hypothetical protein